MPRRKPTGFDSYTFSEDETEAATRLMHYKSSYIRLLLLIQQLKEV